MGYSIRTNVSAVNMLRPTGQNFVDDIFICIFLKRHFGILIQISWNSVSRDPVDNLGPSQGFAANNWQANNWTNDDSSHPQIYTPAIQFHKK